MSNRRFDFPSDVTLPGGFHCTLRPSEVNRWKDFFVQQSTYKEALRTDVDLQCATSAMEGGQADREAEVRAIMQLRQKLWHDCYAIARDWYAGIVAEDSQALPPQAAAPATETAPR